jgi:hypothetical protein
MAQTVHPLDFQLLDFHQLSAMEVPFLLPQNIRSEPDKFMPREGQTSDLPS